MRNNSGPKATVCNTSGHWAVAMLLASGLTGCSSNFITGPTAETGANLTASDSAAEPAPRTATEQRHQPLAELARAYEANPRDPQHALSYVRSLKANGKPKEALAVLDTAAEAMPDDGAIKSEHGLLALEMGQTGKAQAILRKAAQSPTKDWRVLSGLGIAASSQGRQKEAQRHFTQALALSPNNPAVLNNMAMSLILERKVDKAEELLRLASKGGEGPSVKVAQNLALTQALRSEQSETGDNGGAGGSTER